MNVVKACSKTGCMDYNIVPGWNEHFKEAHNKVRKSYLLRHNTGKPRHGLVFDYMRTRLFFKSLHRQCQSNEETAWMDTMAKSLRDCNAVFFWKNVSKTHSKVVPLAI